MLVVLLWYFSGLASMTRCTSWAGVPAANCWFEPRYVIAFYNHERTSLALVACKKRLFASFQYSTLDTLWRYVLPRTCSMFSGCRRGWFLALPVRNFSKRRRFKRSTRQSSRRQSKPNPNGSNKLYENIGRRM